MTAVTNLLKSQVLDLGLIPYRKAYEVQKHCMDINRTQGLQSLILCEHPPVLTLGRLAKESNFLWPQNLIRDKGVEIHIIDRGGEITLHSPGQLVVYPVLDLVHFGKDLHKYLHDLEEVMIDLCDDFGIVANRNSINTGIFVKDQKIGSIGIGVRKWISYHGLALNVNTDLNLYSMIKPCGLDVTMTSMAQIMGETVSIKDVMNHLIKRFNKVFHLQLTCNTDNE